MVTDPRDIIHIDMDAYFASVEQRDVPLYRGKPLAICHTDDIDSIRGVISTASYEARRYGLGSAMNVLDAKRLCPNAIYIAGNYEKYLYNTKQILKICRNFSDLVEVYSVDEFFLDVTHTRHLFGKDAVDVAFKLKERISNELRLPLSVGVGPNKLVAKMASGFAKPAGLTVISPEDLPGAFAYLPVEELVGVGRKMKRRLGSLGVRTIGDLANLPLKTLQDKYGINGELLHMAANGIDHSPVTRAKDTVKIKSFGHSMALGSGVQDMAVLKHVLLGLAEGVARRMRKDNYMGRTINLWMALNRMFGRSRSRSLNYFMAKPRVIHEVASELLVEEQGLVVKYPVTTIGVSVSNLIDSRKGYQLSIFDVIDPFNCRETALLETLDSIERRFGRGTVSRASLLSFRRRYHSVPKIEIAQVDS